MEDIKAIDVMNYLFTPEAKKQYFDSDEYAFATRRLRGGKREQLTPAMYPSAMEFVAYMDEAGYEKVFITAWKMFSWANKRLQVNNTIEQVYEQVKMAPERLVGVAGYNPLKIQESLQEIETAVKECGFKYVYFHSLSFGLALNDKKLYPCYAKCAELGIPVGMQVGHAAENLPSEGGRPIYLDEVALDFPNLKIIASHTGWPWVDELVAMAMKHENIYCDISAWPPEMLPAMHAPLLRFIDTRIGREKTLWGSNGRGMKEYREQFLALPLREDTKSKILRENAIALFGL
ncbi:MAG: amidohydrolase [Chloroflexi bacterium]|nr:amidohydrolase [Chloroflexota bacterium]